jgi:hypothetical protein
MVFAIHSVPLDFGWIDVDELSVHGTKSWWERFSGTLGRDTEFID